MKNIFYIVFYCELSISKLSNNLLQASGDENLTDLLENPCLTPGFCYFKFIFFRDLDGHLTLSSDIGTERYFTL